jgi:hypothetical protein
VGLVMQAAMHAMQCFNRSEVRRTSPEHHTTHAQEVPHSLHRLRTTPSFVSKPHIPVRISSRCPLPGSQNHPFLRSDDGGEPSRVPPVGYVRLHNDDIHTFDEVIHALQNLGVAEAQVRKDNFFP